jgi:hypothetical protein
MVTGWIADAQHVAGFISIWSALLVPPIARTSPAESKRFEVDG